uniref:hypothetical protein n=1 Tax=Burkholderia sp. Ac-20379 TaxID=2703900 RepID=UPI001F122526|nr:hypothetical protein [Burkholderia sp. Ac-20379]
MICAPPRPPPPPTLSPTTTLLRCKPIAAPASATTGAHLARQARSRLAASLATNAALSDGRSITAAQARANGLPFIARHFDQIDTAHSGRVSLQQVRQYLQREPQ